MVPGCHSCKGEPLRVSRNSIGGSTKWRQHSSTDSPSWLLKSRLMLEPEGALRFRIQNYLNF